MTKLGVSAVCLLVGTVFLSSALGDPLEKCQPRNETYNIGDNEQCDKYYLCGPSGKMSDAMCDDGFVFSIEYFVCDYPHNVDCTSRPKLQVSPSTNPRCARMNGFYPFPPKESCQKFHHCLQGEAYEKTCPEGVIFDDTKGACVHPDSSARKDCSASTVLNFVCPNAGNKFAKLKFGNHDRHSHPTDCQMFYTCSQDGNPRLAGCSVGKVFNPKTGKCSLPSHVPQCVDWYKNKTEEELRQQDADPDNDDNGNEDSENSAEPQVVAVKVPVSAASTASPRGPTPAPTPTAARQQSNKRPGKNYGTSR